MSLALLFFIFNNSQAQTVFESGVGVPLQNLVTLSKGNNPNLSDPNLTFNGNGYLGLRTATPGFPELFTESFNLEVVGGLSHTRSVLQVDISSLLHGFIIHSAELSFLLGSQSGTQTVTASVISFETSGSIGYNWNPTALSGPVVQTVVGGNDPLRFNTIDVASLLQARINQGQSWLGLHLSATGSGNQFLATTTVGQADRAQVRLTVNFSQVPEPNTFAFLGLMLGGMTLVRNRRK
jgi:hypothetical protein